LAVIAVSIIEKTNSKEVLNARLAVPCCLSEPFVLCHPGEAKNLTILRVTGQIVLAELKFDNTKE